MMTPAVHAVPPARSRRSARRRCPIPRRCQDRRACGTRCSCPMLVTSGAQPGADGVQRHRDEQRALAPEAIAEPAEQHPAGRPAQQQRGGDRARSRTATAACAAGEPRGSCSSVGMQLGATKLNKQRIEDVEPPSGPAGADHEPLRRPRSRARRCGAVPLRDPPAVSSRACPVVSTVACALPSAAEHCMRRIRVTHHGIMYGMRVNYFRALAVPRDEEVRNDG